MAELRCRRRRKEAPQRHGRWGRFTNCGLQLRSPLVAGHRRPVRRQAAGAAAGSCRGCWWAEGSADAQAAADLLLPSGSTDERSLVPLLRIPEDELPSRAAHHALSWSTGRYGWLQRVGRVGKLLVGFGRRQGGCGEQMHACALAETDFACMWVHGVGTASPANLMY